MAEQVEDTLTTRDLIRRSRQAVYDHDREGWLALWAPDAVIQDPVGPSPFDPDGNGHHGPEGIAAFYDKVIGPNERITFEIDQSYECGNEVADVGLIRTSCPAANTSRSCTASSPTAATARASSPGCAPTGSSARPN